MAGILAKLCDCLIFCYILHLACQSSCEIIEFALNAILTHGILYLCTFCYLIGSCFSTSYSIRKRFVLEAIFEKYCYHCFTSFTGRSLLVFKNFDLFKRYMKNEVVTVDMERYYKNFCIDSDYPDQIEYNQIGFFNYFNNKNNPLNIACKIGRKNEVLCFDQLDTGLVNRFIELLPSITLTYFSKSSKSIYYQCLDTRGIEFCFFNCKITDGKEKEPALSQNGRLMSSSEIFVKKTELLRFLVCLDVLRCPFDQFEVGFYKTYRQLILEFPHHIFNGQYKQVLQQLLHDRVRTVKMFIYAAEPNFDQNYCMNLANFEDCLKMCDTVDNIGVCFHAFKYNGMWIGLTAPVFLAQDPAFTDIRVMIERWGSSRPTKMLFKLIYKNIGFLLHEHKLKMIRWISFEDSYLDDNYRDSLIQSRDTYQDNFFLNIVSPYPFVPFQYHEYFI